MVVGINKHRLLQQLLTDILEICEICKDYLLQRQPLILHFLLLSRGFVLLKCNTNACIHKYLYLSIYFFNRTLSAGWFLPMNPLQTRYMKRQGLIATCWMLIQCEYSSYRCQLIIFPWALSSDPVYLGWNSWPHVVFAYSNVFLSFLSWA